MLVSLENCKFLGGDMAGRRLEPRLPSGVDAAARVKSGQYVVSLLSNLCSGQHRRFVRKAQTTLLTLIGYTEQC